MFGKLFMRRVVIFVLGIYSLTNIAHAQCPATDFTLPASSCQNGTISASNMSSSGSSSWDFCSGDLLNTPTAQVAFTVTGAVGRPGMEFVKDGNTWYEFVTGTFSNSLFRITYANGLNNTPSLIENLGDLAGKLNSPGQVRIIQDNNLWYGFVHNVTTGELIKIDFGDHVANSFTASILFSGIGTQNSGFALGKDAVNGWICIISEGSNQFRIIRLGNPITSPGGSDFILSSAAPNSNNLGDVDLFYDCGNWYGFADNFANGLVYRLDFGSDLFSSPTITQIASLAPSNYGRLRLAREGEEFFLFVTSLNGNHIKLEFGDDIQSNPTIVDEGSVGSVLPPGTPFYGIAIVKENSVWTVQISDASNGKIYQVNYPNNCSSLPQTSIEVNPMFTYSLFGTYMVSLETTNASGSSVKTKIITVSNALAPDIDFTTQNSCAGSSINFSSVNTSGTIASYSWDFGDGNASSGANPSNIYTTGGNYLVSNTVMGTNGCQNFIQKTVPIYNQPVVDFTLPSPSVTCTNQNYTFTNTSTYDPGSNPAWKWSVDGSAESSGKDLIIPFTTTTTASIQLVATIPGCSPQKTQPFLVQQQGPIVDFTVGDGCQNNAVQFTNNSSGSISGYSWSFGDGNTSAATNPQNTYSLTGPYTISLTASSASGCNNTATKDIKIYSKPQTDFSIDLPPFSCSGSPSKFRDQTPGLSDSNLASWLWDFADPTSGQNSSVSENPTHTYATAGLYSVKLTATTNNNCSTTIQKSVIIGQSPVASFTNTPPCKDVVTKFSDTSGSSTGWIWQIGGTFYNNVSNPQHIFTAAGNYTINFTVTSTNGCIASASKVITVPTPLSPDFSVQKNCTNQDTNFIDATLSTADPVTKRDWDFASLGTGTGSPAIFSFQTAGNYGVKLKVTAQSGCTYTIAKNVNIVSGPVASFTATPDSGVPPLTVQFTNTSSQATDYLWTFHNASDVTSTVTSPSFTFVDFGDHLVDLKASNTQGCSNTISKIIQAVLPVNDISIIAFGTTKNADGLLNAIATLKNNGNVELHGVSMIMDLSGRATVRDSIKASIPPNQLYNHLFNFSITDVTQLNYLCAEVEMVNDADLTNNRICTSLSTETFLFDPYPNPVSEELHIDFIADGDDLAALTVVDALGKRVLQTSFQVSAGLNQFVLPVTNFGNGIYIVTIQTSSVKKMRQIAVSR